ncbi:hypothetical protein ACFLZX_01965 [Nanoarchaeota archaeon]
MHHNPYSAGHEVLVKSSSYNVDSHGDYGATVRFLSKEDLPSYTAMFYSQSESESINEIRYSKVDPQYDKGFKEFSESLRGPPLEVYVPQRVVMPSAPASAESKTIATDNRNEIEKALLKVKEVVIEEITEKIIIRKKRKIVLKQ